MQVSDKIERWMRTRGLSYSGAGKVLGISAQSLHAGIRRGTFSRLTIGKMLKLIPETAFEDFLLAEEREEIRKMLRQTAA